MNSLEDAQPTAGALQWVVASAVHFSSAQRLGIFVVVVDVVGVAAALVSSAWIDSP